MGKHLTFKDIDNAFKRGLIIQSHILSINSREFEDFLKLINYIIMKFNLDFNINSIAVIVTELIQNAIKANLKKIFFARHNIDPENKEEYKKGIELFRDYITSLGDFTDTHILTDNGYFVKARIMDYDRHGFVLQIINNTKLYEAEKERISEKIEFARQFNNIIEFYTTVNDENTEGAGLGFVLILLTLRDLGIAPDNFSIYDAGPNTVAQVKLKK